MQDPGDDPPGPNDPNDRHDAHDDDADAAGATGSAAVPHPMDRVWRHPSEIGRSTPRRSSPGRRPAPATPRSRRTWPTAVAGAAVGSLVTIGLLAATGVLAHDHTVTITTAGLSSQPRDDALRKAAAAVQPAVVSVLARDASGARRGSGVCIRHGTEIVTAASVVGAAKVVTVTGTDGTPRLGAVKGSDGASGVALVDVTSEITAAPLTTQPPATGESVFVVGHDGYLDLGIVTDRDEWLADGAITMRGLLGTNITGDGGTGGALVDRNGAVAGIVVDTSGTVLPMSYAEQVVDGLRRTGHVAHGWIGITGGDRSGRALVMKVDNGSPAAGAGIAPGDTIIAADRHPVLGMAEVVVAIRSHWPGDAIELTLVHDAKERVVRVAIGAPPHGVPATTTGVVLRS